MFYPHTSSFLAVVAALLLLGGEARAGEDDVSRQPSERGQVEYLRYCASCHGESGEGNGPVASALQTPPTDLTRLGERYGTPLPRGKMLAFIDGRRPLVSHGDREMPVWGEQLWKDLPSRTPESRKRSTMLVILDYLDSLQPPAS